MSNTGIKKLLFAVISLLLVAAVVAISFAVWDTKTADSKFAATGGERINVELDTTDGKDSGFSQGKLIPDGMYAGTGNAISGSATTPQETPVLYLYAKFTPKMTNDTDKNAVLRWKFTKLTINGDSMIDNDGKLKSDSILDCWVSEYSTYERQGDAIAPTEKSLTSGTKYYFVVKFKTYKYREYKHTDNKTYKFYSDGQYTIDGGNKQAYTKAILQSLGVTYNDALSLYDNAPYQSEHIDADRYTAYSGKKIETEIKIYAAEGPKS